MTKFRDIHRRIDRIGAGGAGRSVPHILRVRTLAGETIAAAHERFNAEYPYRPRGHHVLVVPAKPRTDAEHELQAEQFWERQLALRNNARRERIAAPKVSANQPPPTFLKGGGVFPPT